MKNKHVSESAEPSQKEANNTEHNIATTIAVILSRRYGVEVKEDT